VYKVTKAFIQQAHFPPNEHIFEIGERAWLEMSVASCTVPTVFA